MESAPEDNNTTAPNTPRGAFSEQQSAPVNTNSLPPEMMFYIEKQEDYIDQLEKESQYCRVSISIFYYIDTMLLFLLSIG